MKHFWRENKILCLRMLAVATVLGVSLYAGLRLWPLFVAIGKDAEAFKSTIASMGLSGWLALFALQVAQIVIAVIPGEPVEILAGMLYGGFGGFITCEIGILVGTVVVYYLARLLGYPIITAFIPEKKLQKFHFLQDERRLSLITFILFFIPGTPKDVLTYFVGFTKIKPLHFFAIATAARIPSVLTSTLAGGAMMNGNWQGAVLIFAATGLLAFAGIWINRKIMQKKSAAKPLHEMPR